MHSRLIEEGGADLEPRLAALDLATLALHVVDDADEGSGDQLAAAAAALHCAHLLVDVATDFVPGVSLAKDIVSITTGVSPVTGDGLTEAERAMTLGSLILPSAVSGIAHNVSRVSKTLGRLAQREGRIARRARDMLALVEQADSSLRHVATKSLPCVLDR